MVYIWQCSLCIYFIFLNTLISDFIPFFSWLFSHPYFFNYPPMLFGSTAYTSSLAARRDLAILRVIRLFQAAFSRPSAVTPGARGTCNEAIWVAESSPLPWSNEPIMSLQCEPAKLSPSLCISVHDVFCGQWSLTNPRLTPEERSVSLDWCLGIFVYYGENCSVIRYGGPPWPASLFLIMFQTVDFGQSKF